MMCLHCIFMDHQFCLKQGKEWPYSWKACHEFRGYESMDMLEVLKIRQEMRRVLG